MSATLAAATIGDAVSATHVIINPGANIVLDSIYFHVANLVTTLPTNGAFLFFETTAGFLQLQSTNVNPVAATSTLFAPIILGWANGLVIPRGAGLQLRTLLTAGCTNFSMDYSIFGSLVP